MGLGIAQVCSRHGYWVHLADATQPLAVSARSLLVGQLQQRVKQGKMAPEDVEAITTRIVPSEVDEALSKADLVIEAIAENLNAKLAFFERADRLAPEEVILTSNTSSISITRLAACTRRPSQVMGMHFMNPVPRMQLVELVRGLQTDEATYQTVRSLAQALQKTTITAVDRPGFVVNRILVPLINEACFALQEGLSSAEDIDVGTKLGLNHPMGPFELADLIGLDTVLAIAEILHAELGEDKYRPAPLLRNYVAAGWFGRKAGRGFYSYDATGKLSPNR